MNKLIQAALVLFHSEQFRADCEQQHGFEVACMGRQDISRNASAWCKHVWKEAWGEARYQRNDSMRQRDLQSEIDHIDSMMC
jgi:hypothetical protein